MSSRKVSDRHYVERGHGPYSNDVVRQWSGGIAVDHFFPQRHRIWTPGKSAHATSGDGWPVFEEVDIRLRPWQEVKGDFTYRVPTGLRVLINGEMVYDSIPSEQLLERIAKEKIRKLLEDNDLADELPGPRVEPETAEPTKRTIRVSEQLLEWLQSTGEEIEVIE